MVFPRSRSCLTSLRETTRSCARPSLTFSRCPQPAYVPAACLAISSAVPLQSSLPTPRYRRFARACPKLCRPKRFVMHPATPSCLQDPLYAPNYYLSMEGFRELTSRRVSKFVGQVMGPGQLAAGRLEPAQSLDGHAIVSFSTASAMTVCAPPHCHVRSPLPPPVLQRFFSVFDYVRDPLKFQVHALCISHQYNIKRL